MLWKNIQQLWSKYWQNLGVSVDFSALTGGSKATDVFNFCSLYWSKIRKIYHDGLTYFEVFHWEPVKYVAHFSNRTCWNCNKLHHLDSFLGHQSNYYLKWWQLPNLAIYRFSISQLISPDIMKWSCLRSER